MAGEYAKSQMLRAWDVLFLGPFLVYAGYRARDPVLKWGLVLSGAGTILYNGNNFIKNELDKKKGKVQIKNTGLFSAVIERN